MGVESTTYSEIEGVERLVGDLVDSRQFSTSTSPSKEEVERLLDGVGFQLNGELEAAGYSTPVSESTDNTGFRWLRHANAAGAAALVLNTVPSQAFDPDAGELSTDRGAVLQRVFDQVVDAIRKGRFPATRTTRRGERIFAGSSENADGETNAPIFTRSLTDFPASRTLTED